MLATETRDNDERPSFEEVYEGATNTSNLKEHGERRGSTDVLRDMAMSSDRLGASLLRVRAQWESSSKPARPAVRPMKVHLAEHDGDQPKALAELLTEKARSDEAYARELMTLVNRLGDLAAVRELLVPVVIKWGWGRPVDPVERSERSEQRGLNEAALAQRRADLEAASDDEKPAAQEALNFCIIAIGRNQAEWDREDEHRARAKIGPVIRYWLDQTCTVCDGTKWELVTGTRRQSTKMCRQCEGGGFLKAPHGEDGKRLANYMDNQAHRYSQRMKARRKAFAAIPAIDKLSKRMQPKVGNIDPEAD